MDVNQNKCSGLDESVNEQEVIYTHENNIRRAIDRTEVSTDSVALPEFHEVAEPLKSFAPHLATKEEENCFPSTSNNGSSMTAPSVVEQSDEFSSLCTIESLPSNSEDTEEKFDRNLQKFLKVYNGVKLRKKTKQCVRNIKSDGEIGKIINYCSDMSQISSILSKTSVRSSAPSTFNYEIESNQKCRYEKLFGSFKNGKETQDEGEFSGASSLVEINLESKFSEIIHNSSQNKNSEAFKAPFSPSQIKSMFPSPETAKPKELATVKKRPSDLNVSARKAFYTFSPESGNTGVLRLCHSMPNMNRPFYQREETHRRSINFGEHARIVRSLFKDKPEPSTPVSKVSIIIGGSPIDDVKDDSKRGKSSDGETAKNESKSMSHRQSTSCRKLIFDASDNKIEKRLVALANVESVSPSKRKNASPVVCNYTSAFAKRVRTSQLKNKEGKSDDIKLSHSAPEETKDHLKPGCSRVPGSSPLKRKAEDEDNSSNSSTEGIPSKIFFRQ